MAITIIGFNLESFIRVLAISNW